MTSPVRMRIRSTGLAAFVAAVSLLGCGTASTPDDRDETGDDVRAGDVATDASTDLGAGDTAPDDAGADAAATDAGGSDTVSADAGDAGEADTTDATSDPDTSGADDASSDGGDDTDPDVFVPPVDAGPPDCGDQTACGIVCTDLNTDPTNCGLCGLTCIVPNATAACVEGACAVGACDPGFFDRDGALGNGCEVEDACVPDVPCATECGGESAVVCDAGEAICPAPAETCNGLDDDCDGACDEGPLPGCRQGIHRGSGNGHVYSDDLAFVQRAPYRVESANYFYLYSEAATTLRPVFLCNKGDGKRFLTTATDCEIGRAPERTIGFWSPSPTCGAVPLYRMYQASSNNHFYTISAPERDRARDELGYREEGIAGYVWRSP